MTSDTPTIDLSRLRHFADSAEEMESFMDIFISQAEETLLALRAGCQSGNTLWTEAAHKLKGGAGTIGAAHLHDLCARAQEMEAGTPARARCEILQAIETAYADVKKHIEAERRTGQTPQDNERDSP